MQRREVTTLLQASITALGVLIASPGSAAPSVAERGPACDAPQSRAQAPSLTRETEACDDDDGGQRTLLANASGQPITDRATTTRPPSPRGPTHRLLLDAPKHSPPTR